MALSQQQLNFCTDLMNLAAQQRAVQLAEEDLKSRWFNNAFSGILDADLVGNAQTAHLTQAKLSGGINAISAILTALGDDSTGQAINLTKLKG